MTSRDLTGRTFVVTGSNTGIGRVTAEELAKRGARVILACRSKEKTEPVLAAMKKAGADVDFLALDLGDLAAVRASAEELLSRDEPLHVLVNNAGLAGTRGQTKDGFELAFGTNHLGPFLFTTLLLPKLRATATAAEPARIVNVSSGSHYDAKSLPFEKLRARSWSVTGLDEYAVSKLCNVLFTKSLAAGKAGANVTSYALHPGTMIATDIWRSVPFFLRPILRLFMMPLEEGAKTTLRCATAPELANEDGLYWTDGKVKEPSALAKDSALAAELWTKSEEWTRA